MFAILHILILVGIVSPDIVWGGQIDGSPERLLILEIVALVATSLFIAIIVLRIRSIGSGKPQILLRIGIWIIFAYLVLNTLGNLASGVSAETLIFAPSTLIMALFALRLAIEPRAKDDE